MFAWSTRARRDRVDQANIQGRPTPRTYESTKTGGIFVVETGKASVALISAANSLTVIDGGTYVEPQTAGVALNSAAYTFQGTVDGGTFPESTKTNPALISAAYSLVIVDGGSFTETGAKASPALL